MLLKKENNHDPAIALIKKQQCTLCMAPWMLLW